MTTKERWISDFATRFKEALEITGITPADISRATGIGEGSLSNYRSGRYEPKQKRADAIARALNVSIAWLTGGNVPFGPYEGTVPSFDDVEDAEVWEIRQALRENPGMRVLFSAAKGVTAEDLEAAANIIRRFRKESEGE